MSSTSQRDLVTQINLMNRVHAALSSSLNSDEVYSLILGTMTAPSGLNFERAILFLYDQRADRLTGHVAMGPMTAEEAAERRAEFDAEANALKQIAATMAQAVAEGAEQDTHDRESFFDLQHSAHWINILQSHRPDDKLTKVARKVVEEGSTPPEELRRPRRAKRRLIDYADDRKPRLASRERVELPPALENVLAEYFVVLPLKGGGGPRGIVVADRRFAKVEDLVAADLEPLEWFQAQATLALDNSELFCSLQRAYQDLKEMDKLKSNFLSTVSHELRTPLTAINGFVQLLAAGRVGELTPTQKNLLERVRLQGAHMANMVNDIIEMTEFQMGGLDEMDLEAVDPLGCFFNVLPKLEPRSREKNIAIEPNVGAEVPMIRCNNRALERVYYHLLDNAVKFSDEGSRVELGFRPGASDSELLIDIKDEGIGIPPENLEQIFQNFYQVDNNLTRSRNGMGLGLTITKILLESIGGSVSVESAPNRGSVFTLSFPVWSEEVDGSAGTR
jgi:signal transduction histidine kinase